MLRTHTCGEVTLQHKDTKVTLCGWVNKIRNFGGMTFIDLRDRYGITQITYDPSTSAIQLPEIKPEYVLQVTGTVLARPQTMINKDMLT